ncbi:MAG: tRNA pseudouridine(13) synthase TruD [Candidatus Woesearchaeota archaeon]
MKVKHLPEDFVVEEVIDLDIKENGNYAYFLLTKKNYNTLKAIELIATKLKVPIKNIGFAGTKDRQAITTQYCSLYKGRREQLEKISLDGIKVEFVGYGDEQLYLGRHKGNHFIITIRDLDEKEADQFEQCSFSRMINYFGEQRFSNNNAKIGKAIVKKDFKQAIELIFQNHGEQEQKVKEYLKKNPTDYIGALRVLPFKLLKLFVGAYQSKLWNVVAEEFSAYDKNLELPIIGFGTAFEDSNVKKAYEALLRKEKITLRDFVIPQIPDLSSEGNKRQLFIDVVDFSVSEAILDECFSGKKKIVVQFTLPSGSYATSLINQLPSACLI